MKKMMFLSVFFMVFSLVSLNANAGVISGQIESIKLTPYNHFTLIINNKHLGMCKGSQDLPRAIEDINNSAYYQLAMEAFRDGKQVTASYRALQGNLGCLITLYIKKSN